MKLLRTSFLTAVVVALLGLALSLTYQKGVEAQVGSTPVRVVNTALAPALTRNVDRRQPYHEFAFADPGAGDSFHRLVLPAVPAGKRLVIEAVSELAIVALDENATATLHARNIGGFRTLHHLPVQFQGRFFGSNIFSGSHTLQVFVEAGESPAISVQRSGTSGFWSVEATVSGYLEDL
jgi:hypothetical protein